MNMSKGSNGCRGRLVGFAEITVHALTYKILINVFRRFFSTDPRFDQQFLTRIASNTTTVLLASSRVDYASCAVVH